ncbi:MAG: glycosyltransferase [Pirellulales bacterium]|nr:glycosyltransferase [Pirellulales bacterium]
MTSTDNFHHLQHSALPPLALPPAIAPAVPPTAAPVKTLRVLHLINGEHYAGAERVQDLLAKRLPEFGYAVGFACLKLDKFYALRQTREAPLFDVPMRSRFDPRVARRVARIVREGRYRILHAHTVRSLLVGGVAAAMTGVPLVYHAHSPTSNDSTSRWKTRLNAAAERMFLGRVSRVIAVSKAMADHIASEGFDRAKIVVVPNGVPSLASIPFRKTPSGNWTLGVVGLFRPRKGLEILIEAMARLRGEGIPVRLLAVGAFESAGYADEIADRLHRRELADQVVWTGFSRDVTAELKKMDLLVLPSLFGEGLPMVVLEAMAAGVPVIASRVPGVPEAIRHGLDGVLVDPADADELARTVAAFVDGEYDWAAMRLSAFERQARLFSDRAMAEGVAVVYNDVLHAGQETEKQPTDGKDAR